MFHVLLRIIYKKNKDLWGKILKEAREVILSKREKRMPVPCTWPDPRGWGRVHNRGAGLARSTEVCLWEQDGRQRMWGQILEAG